MQKWIRLILRINLTPTLNHELVKLLKPEYLPILHIDINNRDGVLDCDMSKQCASHPLTMRNIVNKQPCQTVSMHTN